MPQSVLFWTVQQWCDNAAVNALLDSAAAVQQCQWCSGATMPQSVVQWRRSYYREELTVSVCVCLSEFVCLRGLCDGSDVLCFCHVRLCCACLFVCVCVSVRSVSVSVSVRPCV